MEKGFREATVSFQLPDDLIENITDNVESRMDRKLQPYDKVTIQGIY